MPVPKEIDSEGRIKSGTILTQDINQSIALYDEYFGYKLLNEGVVDKAWAQAMGAPAQEGKRFATLIPSSGTSIFIRFIEGSKVEAYEPLKSYGWASLEITIKDVDKMAASLEGSPFTIIGPPKKLDFSDAFIPMQCVGPSGEVLYLNQVNHTLPGADLPLAKSEVDHIFITPLATPDMNAAIQFYVDAFGWDKGDVYNSPYTVISKAFGLPMDTPFHFGMTQKGDLLNNEVDQYPDGTIERPTAPGELPPGLSYVSFMVESLEAVKATPTSPIFTRSEAPYNGRKAAYFKGAAGELIEAIEI
jgi:catechol 2,3-dioxygenase-like lactoylglutathione lyase family enzyme